MMEVHIDNEQIKKHIQENFYDFFDALKEMLSLTDLVYLFSSKFDIQITKLYKELNIGRFILYPKRVYGKPFLVYDIVTGLYLLGEDVDEFVYGRIACKPYQTYTKMPDEFVYTYFDDFHIIKSIKAPYSYCLVDKNKINTHIIGDAYKKGYHLSEVFSNSNTEYFKGILLPYSEESIVLSSDNEYILAPNYCIEENTSIRDKFKEALILENANIKVEKGESWYHYRYCIVV